MVAIRRFRRYWRAYLSKRLGFHEQGEGVEGITISIAAKFDWCSVIGQMPILDYLLTKNPIHLKFFSRSIAFPIINFSQWRMMERLNEEDKQDESLIEIKDPELRAKELKRQGPLKPDFLSRFLFLCETNLDIVTDKQLLAYLFVRSPNNQPPTFLTITTVNAYRGTSTPANTVASTLPAIFYYILKYPSTLVTLLTELNIAYSSNRLTSPPHLVRKPTTPVSLRCHQRRPPHAPRPRSQPGTRRTRLRFEARRRIPPARHDRWRESLGQAP
jgi:hypothetical protein